MGKVGGALAASVVWSRPIGGGASFVMLVSLAGCVPHMNDPLSLFPLGAGPLIPVGGAKGFSQG